MGLLQKFKDHYRSITLATYLLPILVSVIVSLAHVVAFWDITNPMSWAVFLSVGIEIGVLSSIAASRISNAAWIPFIIVTFIQIVGNIFYSYTDIDVNSRLFKSWVELTDPFFNLMGLGTDGDVIVHKRIVAMSGAFIPLIAIVFFNFFIREIRKGITIVAQVPPVGTTEPAMAPVVPVSEQTRTAANALKNMMFMPMAPVVNEVTPSLAPSLAPSLTPSEVQDFTSSRVLLKDDDNIVSVTPLNEPRQPVKVITDPEFYDNINNHQSPASIAIEQMTQLPKDHMNVVYGPIHQPRELEQQAIAKVNEIANSENQKEAEAEAIAAVNAIVEEPSDLAKQQEIPIDEPQVTEPEKKK